MFVIIFSNSRKYSVMLIKLKELCIHYDLSFHDRFGSAVY